MPEFEMLPLAVSKIWCKVYREQTDISLCLLSLALSFATLSTIYSVPYTPEIPSTKEAAIFLSHVGLSPLCTSEQNICDGAFNLREPAKRCSQISALLAYSPVTQLNPVSWPFSNMNSVPCGYNLLSDRTTRFHCSVWANMTLSAASERKGCKSTVSNLSLYQTPGKL